MWSMRHVLSGCVSIRPFFLARTGRHEAVECEVGLALMTMGTGIHEGVDGDA